MWENSVVERVFDDGWRIIRPYQRAELEALGNIQGHCSGHHSFWTDPKHTRPYAPVEYMFVLVNPQDEPKVTVHSKLHRWLNKEHPLDEKCKRSGINAYSGTYIRSDYYDHNVSYRGGFDLSYYERQVDNARYNYEQLKIQALVHGPLGPEHPYKYELDRANRAIQGSLSRLKEMQDKARFNTGSVFTYKRNKLVVLGITGRGMDFNGKESYVDRFVQFAGKVTRL